MNKLLIAISLLLLLLGIVQVACYHPHLPDQMATHFNGKGEADGHSSKTTHAYLMIGLQVGTLVLFLLVSISCKYMPASMINIPDREYWLAPERRGETVAKLNTGLIGMAIATQLLLMGINQLTILHNLGFPAMTGGWFWILLGAYLAFSLGFCIWLMLRFRKPAGETFSASV